MEKNKIQEIYRIGFSQKESKIYGHGSTHAVSIQLQKHIISKQMDFV
jgi:hypothetical protein